MLGRPVADRVRIKSQLDKPICMNNGPKFARWLFAAAVAGLSARVLASRSRLFPPRRCLRLPEVNKSLMSVPDLRTSGKKLEDSNVR